MEEDGFYNDVGTEEYYERQKEKDWFYPTHGMSYEEKKKNFEIFKDV